MFLRVKSRLRPKSPTAFLCCKLNTTRIGGIDWLGCLNPCPIFAAAFATHSSHDGFLRSCGIRWREGLIMGITEAMSDDGAITGRGSRGRAASSAV